MYYIYPLFVSQISLIETNRHYVIATARGGEDVQVHAMFVRAVGGSVMS